MSRVRIDPGGLEDTADLGQCEGPAFRSRGRTLKVFKGTGAAFSVRKQPSADSAPSTREFWQKVEKASQGE